MIRFRTASGSTYTYDEHQGKFERVEKGMDAGELRSETGHVVQQPEIKVGHCALFFCDPIGPGRPTRLVCTSRVTEILEAPCS